jgi:hypothetical protein
LTVIDSVAESILLTIDLLERLKVEEKFATLERLVRREMFPEPCRTLVVDPAATLHGEVFQSVGKIDEIPLAVLKGGGIRSNGIPLDETPGRVHRVGLTTGPIQWIETCRGKAGLLGPALER